MDDFKRLHRTLAYEGSIINVYQDHVQVNGKEADWDFMHHDGGAAVIPVTQEGKILMVRQWRNALDRYTLEIPAGKLDFSGESSQTCVMRELEEETGYCSDNVDFLIAINSWPAFTNEKVDIFVAKDLIKTTQHLDEEESIELEEYTIEELKDMIFKGEIKDSKTVAGLLAYALKYE